MSHDHNAQVTAYAAAMPAYAQPIFAHLRALIHTTCPDTDEAIKWSIPHFERDGDYLCIFAASPGHASFTFYKQQLMSDPRLRDNLNLPAIKRFMGRLTSLSDLPDDATLAAMLQEAADLNARGVRLPDRAPKTPPVIDMPSAVATAVATALAANPAAQAVWDAKSAAWRKDYLVWITAAKTDPTRDARIAEALDWIADGKARFWKYQK
jgi:hypothetical protein